MWFSLDIFCLWRFMPVKQRARTGSLFNAKTTLVTGLTSSVDALSCPHRKGCCPWQAGGDAENLPFHSYWFYFADSLGSFIISGNKSSQQIKRFSGTLMGRRTRNYYLKSVNVLALCWVLLYILFNSQKKTPKQTKKPLQIGSIILFNIQEKT